MVGRTVVIWPRHRHHGHTVVVGHIVLSVFAVSLLSNPYCHQPTSPPSNLILRRLEWWGYGLEVMSLFDYSVCCRWVRVAVSGGEMGKGNRENALGLPLHRSPLVLLSSIDLKALEPYPSGDERAQMVWSLGSRLGRIVEVGRSWIVVVGL